MDEADGSLAKSASFNLRYNIADESDGSGEVRIFQLNAALS